MDVFLGIEQLDRSLGPVCLTWGGFDGLHLGHRELLKTLADRARARRLKSVVLSFSPLPGQVLQPSGAFRPLFSRTHLIETLPALGVDVLILEPFDLKLASLGPHEFLDRLLARVKIHHLVAGYDLGFGRRREGTIATVELYGHRHGFTVETVKPLKSGGHLISSRAIRRALSEGKVDVANQMLGRPFYVRGLVRRGKGRGCTIGVPTANVRPGETILPRSGVYVTRTRTLGAMGGSQGYASVTNVGRAPTVVDNGDLWIEAHILDHTLDLYGSEVEIEFLDYLREERRFDNVSMLKEQLIRDIEDARRYFAI